VPISLCERLPDALKAIETRPLFVLREQIPPLLVIGQTPNAFRRVGLRKPDCRSGLQRKRRETSPGTLGAPFSLGQFEGNYQGIAAFFSDS
jgi:hypothetical protein